MIIFIQLTVHMGSPVMNIYSLANFITLFFLIPEVNRFTYRYYFPKNRERQGL